MVSPCPKAPYAMGYKPKYVDARPGVSPGGYSPRSTAVLSDAAKLGNRNELARTGAQLFQVGVNHIDEVLRPFGTLPIPVPLRI